MATTNVDFGSICGTTDVAYFIKRFMQNDENLRADLQNYQNNVVFRFKVSFCKLIEEHNFDWCVCFIVTKYIPNNCIGFKKIKNRRL